SDGEFGGSNRDSGLYSCFSRPFGEHIRSTKGASHEPDPSGHDPFDHSSAGRCLVEQLPRVCRACRPGSKRWAWTTWVTDVSSASIRTPDWWGMARREIPAAAARGPISMMLPQQVGQGPLAIERHFYMMSATQYSFIAHIPTVSGIDIALWDLAGKITCLPIYRLLGGLIRKAVPVYSHGGPRNLLDKAECRAWADQIKAAPEGFTAFKFGFGNPGGGRAGGGASAGAGGRGGGRPTGPYNPTLDGAVFRKTAHEYTNLREALGDEIDIAMHCTGQFDTRSSIGLCKAIEPCDPLWIEDPLTDENAAMGGGKLSAPALASLNSAPVAGLSGRAWPRRPSTA